MDKKFALTTLHFMFLKLERWTASLEVTTIKRRALAKELVYRVHGKEAVLLTLKFM